MDKENTTRNSEMTASSKKQSFNKRLISLDAFRGWTMFWIVGGGSIMTGLAAMNLGNFGSLFEATTVLVVEWLILYWMYKRKIFLTA